MDAGDAAAKPSFTALLGDPASWKPLPDPGECGWREGKTTPNPFPKRVWSSCGMGCSEAPAPPPFAEDLAVEEKSAAGVTTGGETYVLLEVLGKTGRIIRIERVSDEATLGMVATSSPCVAVGGGAAPLLYTITDTSKGRIYGRAPSTPGASITWHSTWLNDQALGEEFVFDDGYGTATDLGAELYPSPATVTPTSLEGPAHSGHGLGKQLVWAGADGAIRSYTAAGGTVVLVPATGSRRIRYVRLSDDSLVWTDTGSMYVPFDSAQWHSSPRATAPSGIVVHDGPTIPIVVDELDMLTSGNWAVVTGCGVASDTTTRSCHVFGWNLATGATYDLPNRPNRHFLRILGVTPDEVLLGEIVWPRNANTDRGIVSLVRVRHDAVPALAKAWGQ